MHRVLSVHRAGVDFALRLQLNVQQDQYYGFLRDSAGFKVMVHDQDEPAMINELGFAIQPGTHTFCSLKKIVVSTYLNVIFISALAPNEKTDNLTCKIIYGNFTCENCRFSNNHQS